MRIALGVVFILFGGIGWLGQLVSGINYQLAQRLGLQEKSAGTDPLFRRLETNAARWDSLVLWTLLAAGVLMLADSSLWPYFALVAGGIYLDGAGREAAKCLGLRNGGVRIGDARDLRIAFVFFSVMAAVALAAIACAAWSLS